MAGSAPKLRLHRAGTNQQGDTIPFPGLHERGWKPRLAGEGSFPDVPVDAIAMAEAALGSVDNKFLQLRALVGDYDDRDRPRAA